MGDAPGDIGPGRLALGSQKLRHIVEGDDEAVALGLAALGADAQQQAARAPAALDIELRLHRPLGAAMASSSSGAISGTIPAAARPHGP
jgi:hypothetical protein